MTDLIVLSKGCKCFSVNYSIFFFTDKRSVLNQTVIIKEIYTPIEAVEDFKKYLTLLFSEEDILPEFEINNCKEVFDI